MKKVKTSVMYILLSLWALVNLFPLYWMFTFSLKTNKEIFGDNIIGLPKEWLWSNYSEALDTGNMALYFANSAIVTFATIALQRSDFLSPLSGFVRTANPFPSEPVPQVVGININGSASSLVRRL